MMVMRTFKRPVPLKHHIYCKDIIVVKEPGGEFLEKNFRDF